MTTHIRFAEETDRKMDIVVTGTGRSGTGFAARWLTSIGLPSGHEVFFGPWSLKVTLRLLSMRKTFLVGECSWLAAPYLDSSPLRDALAIHQVRHPKKVVESALRRQNGPKYAAYLEQHLPRTARYENELDKMVCQWIYWNRMVEDSIKDRPSIFWRIEDGTGDLLQRLEADGLIDVKKILPAQMFSNTHYNHKTGPEVTVQLEDIHPDLLAPLHETMKRYGYDRWN